MRRMRHLFRVSVTSLLLLLILLLPSLALSFVPWPRTASYPSSLSKQPMKRSQYYQHHRQHQQQLLKQKQPVPPPSSFSYGRIDTRRFALLDVPDNFFTILLPSLSLFLAFSKAVARSRLEERAWEQRLEEARSQQLKQDPALTEVDLIRKEAAAEWSAYGTSSSDAEQQQQDDDCDRRSASRRVMTRDDYGHDDDNDDSSPEALRRKYTMTQEDVEEFEEAFGVDYDPYYDDPYTEEELPDNGVPYKVDKLYGDRIYKDGEVFYKDDKTGLYYRQGSRPRIQKFW